MTPDRGDILHLEFDPASGQEMQGRHFCLVVSPKTFNQRFKLAWVCPISGGISTVARDSGFLIPLMGFGLRTDGSVHVHQLKAMDWQARKAWKIEQVPQALLMQVMECLVAVLDDAA